MMSSRLNQTIFHLPDGLEQRARDDATRKAIAAEPNGMPVPGRNPKQWAGHTKSRIQYDYDASSEVEKWWIRGGKEDIEAIAGGYGSDDSCCNTWPSGDNTTTSPRSPSVSPHHAWWQ